MRKINFLILILIELLLSFTQASAKLFDSCDNLSTENGYWSREVAGELSINTSQKIEGSASIQVFVPSTAYDAYIFKRPNDPKRWDFTNESLIRFRIYPVEWVPSISFGFTTGEPDGWGWHGYSYGKLNLTANEWNTVEIDLRTSTEGPVSNEALKMGRQILFVPKIYYQRNFTFYIDFIETLEGEYIPPQINIIPTQANLVTNQSQTFSINTYYGKSPYTVNWYLNNTLVATGPTYTFSSNIVGNYSLYANVTDGLNQTAKSNIVNITVRSGGFLEIRAYANSIEIPAIVEVLGIGKYIAPETLVLDTGKYIVSASYGFQNYTKIIDLPEGRTIKVEFNFTLLPPYPTYPLYVEGRYIKNAAGDIVFLRGDNHPGFTDDPAGWWTTYNKWEPDQIRAHLRSMRLWGMNAVRWHTTVAWWLQDNVTFKGVTHSYRQNIKNAIRIAAEEGMYVIFDGYMVVPIGEPGARQTPLPFPPYLNEYEEAYLQSEQAFINYWVSVANELKSYPNVLFEIWNEPVGSGNAINDWFRVAQQVVNAIRATGAENIIVIQWGYGVAPNYNDVTWIRDYPINGSNILYSTHIYRQGNPSWQNAYNYTYAKWGLENTKINWVGDTMNKSLIIGEIGAAYSGNEAENELNFFKNILSILNEWNISYTTFWWRPDGIYAHYDSRATRNPNKVGEALIYLLEEGGTYAVNFSSEIKDKTIIQLN